MPKTETVGGKSQLDKFKNAARQLKADEDKTRWEARLKKVAKSKKDPRASPNSVWDEAEAADDTAAPALSLVRNEMDIRVGRE